jgi:hypothetical protein
MKTAPRLFVGVVHATVPGAALSRELPGGLHGASARAYAACFDGGAHLTSSIQKRAA